MQGTISKSTQRQQCVGGLWGLTSHQVQLDHDVYESFNSRLRQKTDWCTYEFTNVCE